MTSNEKLLGEQHQVVTSDGYNLTVFRLVSTNTSQTKRNCPMLHMPGFATSTDCYFLNSYASISCALADAGYDVWYGNVRGNRYGLKHKTLTPENPEFWKFSIDEMAKIDVHDIIDYIRSKYSACQKIIYSGYSMGGSMGLMYGSIQETAVLQNKICAFGLIAPGFKSCHMTSPITFIPSWSLNGYGPYFPEDWLSALQTFASRTCPLDENKVCDWFYGGAGGGYYQPSESGSQMLTKYVPDISGKTAAQHLLQNKEKCEFNPWSEYYPFSRVSEYNVANISKAGIPARIFYGKKDTIVPPVNMLELCQEMGPSTTCSGYDNAGHLDMVAGRVPYTLNKDFIAFADLQCNACTC